MNKKQLIKELVNELSANNLAIFADEMNLDIDKEESNLVSLVQYYVNSKCGKRSKINQLILDEFSQSATLTENHKILARLPIDTFWTTNMTL